MLRNISLQGIFGTSHSCVQQLHLGQFNSDYFTSQIFLSFYTLTTRFLFNYNADRFLFSHVLYTEGWVCDVALIEYTLGPGKPKEGWDFGREGTRGQWGTSGVSLRATWD